MSMAILAIAIGPAGMAVSNPHDLGRRGLMAIPWLPDDQRAAQDSMLHG